MDMTSPSLVDCFPIIILFARKSANCAFRKYGRHPALLGAPPPLPNKTNTTTKKALLACTDDSLILRKVRIDRHPPRSQSARDVPLDSVFSIGFEPREGFERVGRELGVVAVAADEV